MGLANQYRFAKGSRSRNRDRAVGNWLATKINDSERDTPKPFSVADIAHLAGYADRAVREALVALESLGELQKEDRPIDSLGRRLTGRPDKYLIVWATLNPPDESEPDFEHAEWKARSRGTRFHCPGTPKDKTQRGRRGTRSAADVGRAARQTWDAVKV
jgi:hypothetical protein